MVVFGGVFLEIDIAFGVKAEAVFIDKLCFRRFQGGWWRRAFTLFFRLDEAITYYTGPLLMGDLYLSRTKWSPQEKTAKEIQFSFTFRPKTDG